MNISKKQVGTECILTISGRFDFNSRQDFRESYEAALKNKDLKVINLSMEKMDYLDSAALGMLLILKNKADAENIEIVISDCPQEINKIFNIANFQKIFRFRHS